MVSSSLNLTSGLPTIVNGPHSFDISAGTSGKCLLTGAVTVEQAPNMVSNAVDKIILVSILAMIS